MILYNYKINLFYNEIQKMEMTILQEEELLCYKNIHLLNYLALILHPIPLFFIMILIILYT